MRPPAHGNNKTIADEISRKAKRQSSLTKRPLKPSKSVSQSVKVANAKELERHD